MMSKAITRTFSKEFLKEVLWGDAEGVEVIKDEMYERSRWNIFYELVFKYEDKFYWVSYSRGATEYQDEGPFADEGNEIIVNEVEPREKTIIEYVNKAEIE